MTFLKKITVITFFGFVLIGCGQEVPVLNTDESFKSVESVSLKDSLGGVNSFDYFGVIEARSQVEIYPEMSARIKKKYKNEGDFVRKGELIIELDNGISEESQKLSEADVQIAELNYSDAVSNNQNQIRSINEEIKSAELSLKMMREGARKEEVEIATTLYENAKISYQNASKVLEKTIENNESELEKITSETGNVLESVFDSLDTAMNVDIDEYIYGSTEAVDCHLLFRSSVGVPYETSCANAYRAIDDFGRLSVLEFTSDNLKRQIDALKLGIDKVEVVRSFLNLFFEFADEAITFINSEVTFNDAQMKVLNASALSARARLNSASALLNSHLKKLEGIELANSIALLNAKNIESEMSGLLKRYEKELELKLKGSRDEDVLIQISNIERLKLKLANELRQKDVLDAGVRARLARTKLSVSRLEREKSLIRALADGKILMNKFKENEQVSPSSPVVIIGSDSSFEIEIFIPEQKAEFVKINTPVTIENNNQKTNAKIVSIGSIIDPLKKGIKVVVSAKGNSLVSGQTAKVSFFPDYVGTVYLPLSAIKFEADQPYILKIDGEVAKRVNVEIGNPQGDFIEVLSRLDDGILYVKDARGVNEGDKIKTYK